MSVRSVSFSELETYDCDPTLTDTDVIRMCTHGYMMFEGVVPGEINQRVLEFTKNAAIQHEPLELRSEDWFVEHVLLNPAVAGAIRSLLGAHFHVPVAISNHRYQCPHQRPQEWHVDGASKFTPELDNLQVFYYPQDSPVEVGPTELLPGSHLIRNAHRAMCHIGRIRGSIHTVAPAGSIFLTIYNIWHRRPSSTATCLRQALKYFYWRTAAPKRDWIRENIDFTRIDFSGPAQGLTADFQECFRASQIYMYLCGKLDAYKFMGGQCWPLQSNRKDGPFWGYPKEIEDA